MREKQARETAVSFARDAISLIGRDKPLDVCARKLQAAATVMWDKPLDLATELRELRADKQEAIEELQSREADIEDVRSEVQALQEELESVRAQLAALRSVNENTQSDRGIP